jgi:hypothetical protein
MDKASTTMHAILHPDRTVTLPSGREMPLWRLRSKAFFGEAAARYEFMLDIMSQHLDRPPTLAEMQTLLPALWMTLCQDRRFAAGLAIFLGCFCCAELTDESVAELAGTLDDFSLNDWEALWREVWADNAGPFDIWTRCYVKDGKAERAIGLMRAMGATGSSSDSSAEPASTPETDHSSPRTSSPPRRNRKPSSSGRRRASATTPESPAEHSAEATRC